MDRCRHKGRSKMFPTLLQTPSFDVRVCSELSCTVKVSVECKDGREGQKKGQSSWMSVKKRTLPPMRIELIIVSA
jgi:hypothetical protein